MKIHTKIWKKRLNEAVIPVWEIIDELTGIFNQARRKDRTPIFKDCAKYPSYGYFRLTLGIE